jgi:hypothetical protein
MTIAVVIATPTIATAATAAMMLMPLANAAWAACRTPSASWAATLAAPAERVPTSPGDER